MPLYKYKARTGEGKTVSGALPAADEAALHAILRDDGKYLLSATEKAEKKRRHPISSKELGEFCRQVGVLTSSGVSLMRALNIIAQDETLRPYERSAFDELRRSVRQGISLSDSMDGMGGVFPPLMISMFRAAEASGSLDKTAIRLAEYFDKEYKLSAKIKASTSYPKLLGGLLLVAIVIIMSVVMPQFTDMFSTMEKVPAITRFLLWLSNVITTKWWLLIILALTLYGIIKFVFSFSKVKLFKDRVILHIPLIGSQQRTICTARFARTLSSLYSSGISIVTSLQVCRGTIGNSYIESQFDDVIAKVRAGNNLSDGLDGVDGFVKKLTSSIRVGEETGSLDSMLETTADMLDHESEVALAKMVSYLEPAMIIIMGILVAMVIVGVIMPIYNSYQGISDTASKY